MFLWLSALLVWSIWIQPFIRRNRRKVAPFSWTLFNTPWGILADYRQARIIAAQQGFKPWFRRSFEWLAGTGLTGFIATMGYLCVTTFW